MVEKRGEKQGARARFAAAIFVLGAVFAAAAQPAHAGFWGEMESLPGKFIEGVWVVKNEVLPAAPASTANAWQKITCFFGFCETEKETPTSKNPSSAPSSVKTTEGEKATAGKQAPINDQISNDQSKEGHDPFNGVPAEKEVPAQIVQNIYPEREILTKEVRTVHTKEIQTQIQTNTVIIDQETKDKLNLLLRQMDSDRPNYSAGQSFTLPKNLSGDTLNLANSKFTIDRDGNLVMQSLLSLTASSENPIIKAIQSGSGNALQADHLTFKTGTISTTENNLTLNSATGLIEIAGDGIKLSDAVPSDTDMALYNDSGTLKWNGAVLALGSSVSGTIGYLPKFTASNALGNSALFETGGNIGIGTITPTAKLEVAGGIIANTINGLTPTSQSTGWTIAGGTISKTLTLNDDLNASTVNTHIANTENPHGVTKTQVGLGNVENTALSTWAGTANITTLGVIGAGVWNAGIISPQYGGTGIANNAANTLAFTGNYSLGLTLTDNTSITLPTTGTLTALGNTATGSGNVVLQTSPALTTPSLGVASATTINKLAITAPATSATLTIADGKTFTAGNTLTLAGNDGASLAIGAGGTLGTGAWATIADYAPLANPTFTGTVTIPNPFTLGAISVTATGTQLNYLTGAGGTTGTTNLVFSDSPTLITPNLGVASATSLSTPTLTTASGDLTLDPTGNVVIKGSTADNLAAALNITNSAPASLLFVRNDGNIGINNISPGRKLDIAETAGATPQLRLTSDSSNYAEMYVDSVGGLFLDTTGTSATSISILDQNLRVCDNGSFGAVSCPAFDFSSGTGNLLVENKVVADKFEQICPAGYVWVPGSAKYGTLPGFCVMKYEAKDVGGVATSQATGTPWVNISQENARAQCQALGAGYHLISEAEWMTIAEDIAATPINDIDAGAGLQLATGHTDNDPGNALAAGADPAVSGCNLRLPLSDAANAFAANCQLRDSGAAYGYFGTGNQWSDSGYAAGGSNKSQLRIHALSNGNTIWDIAGNVWEWADAIISQVDQPGVGNDGGAGSGNWGEWNVAYHLVGAAANSRPPDDGWTSTNGIGRLWTYGRDETAATTYRAFLRGGSWGLGASAGAFTLYLNYSPSNVYSYIGFRCAR